MNPIIDLRSDTVTKPTNGMREAMLTAPVGDDVIDIDPTVELLQSRIAELLGKEAAIFMPSGTMTNQIALRVHCRPGDEFLCESGCHIYNYEQGAFAQLSGLVAKTIVGNQSLLDVSFGTVFALTVNTSFELGCYALRIHTIQAGGKSTRWPESKNFANGQNRID